VKRYPRDRGTARRRTAKVPAKSPRRTVDHPLYGTVPLAPVRWRGPDGREQSYWRYDPAFQPPLPAGAVRGDVARQTFCYHHVPKYFYVDENRDCVQCGRPFVFTAQEQKYWYESRQFHFHSVPVRCTGCRRQRRTVRALAAQVGLARGAVEASPDDAAAWMALARALVEAHERTSRGDLNQAISSARRAARLWPEHSEPLLWEGVAHARAGRSARARACLVRYLDQGQGPGQLRSRAEQYVDALDQAP
jgi:hypothetical protein